MKKKIIALTISASVLMTGVVSAASLWGTYRGNDIIRVAVNGIPIRANDVPAISYNNRTMIPISMLKDIGINYTWDQKTKTINIQSSNVTTPVTKQQQPKQVAQIEYPKLYSNDLKTYLGKLTTNKYDADSIYNTYGEYGSKFKTNSIWNEFGDYGSKFSATSAFNELASKPPVIVLGGEIIGYLTTNETIENGVNIVALTNWLTENGY